MKVECPSCQTKFNLPDEKVGSEGANVRCGVCKHVFHVEATSPEDFPGFGDAGASPIWPVSGEGENRSDDFSSQLEDERKKDRFEDVSVSSSEFSSIDFGTPTKREPKLSTKWTVLGILLGLIVLAGVSGTAAYFFEFWPFAKKPIPSPMENAPTPPAKETAPDYATQLVFESYNSYFVDNEKMGEPGKPVRLFVIEGKLVNKSPVNLGQIAIDATLLDTKEAPVLSKSFTAGPKASNFELKTLSKEDLDSRLNSRQEIALYNGLVKPGDEVPFMVVFPDIPETVKNFSLKVGSYLEVAPQNPAQKPVQSPTQNSTQSPAQSSDQKSSQNPEPKK
jgi:predicted Zn finger-like uncharacterized protein